MYSLMFGEAYVIEATMKGFQHRKHKVGNLSPVWTNEFFCK